MEESLESGFGRAMGGALGEVVLRSAFDGAGVADTEVSFFFVFSFLNRVVKGIDWRYPSWVQVFFLRFCHEW